MLAIERRNRAREKEAKKKKEECEFMLGMQHVLLVFRCCSVQMTMLIQGNFSRMRMAFDSGQVALITGYMGP